jgi:hypothetical protein
MINTDPTIPTADTAVTKAMIPMDSGFESSLVAVAFVLLVDCDRFT